MSIIKIGLVAAGLVLPMSATAASLDLYTSFWVLGDSLSDPGNLFSLTGGQDPQSPPYFDGRASNGPVWAEHAAEAFAARGIGGGNLAFGGAEASTDGDGVPDLDLQIKELQSQVAGGAPLGDRPIAAVWFGANDLAGFFDGSDSGDVIGSALADIAGGFEALDAIGFSDVLVFGLPDIGELPIVNGTPGADPASEATRAFNDGLKEIVSGLASFDATFVDAEALFDDLVASPETFGVSDARMPCLVPGEAPCTPQEAQERAFFDLIHPNATIHARIADEALEALAPVPVPAAAWLLIGGLMTLGSLRTSIRRS